MEMIKLLAFLNENVEDKQKKANAKAVAKKKRALSNELNNAKDVLDELEDKLDDAKFDLNTTGEQLYVMSNAYELQERKIKFLEKHIKNLF